MFKYLIRLIRVNRNKKKRNKRRTVVFDNSSFSFGENIMENIEAKLDQAATLLAELMLSQLGFSFIPKVRIEISHIFRIRLDLVEESQKLSFSYYEPLSFTWKEGFDEPIYTVYAI